MTRELAQSLYETARAHALSSDLLYQASLQYALDHNKPDPDQFAFNGTFSLSIFYLIGLGLELFLKAAIALHDKDADLKFLKNEIGHDLVKALDAAEARGFAPEAPNLRAITENLREPYLMHHFRYERPEQMPLPDIAQVIEMFAVLDEEYEAFFALQE